MSACICGANCVASPRDSRCASCCWRSGMGAFAPDYAGTAIFVFASPCTACARVPSSFTESSQPRQASVMLCPKASARPGLEILAAFDEVRFHHHADDAPLAGGDLAADIGGDRRLAPVVLGRVGVRAVDHQPLGQPGARELLARRLHRRRFVVRILAAAQDDVAVVVAARLDDRHLAALVHREEVVLLARGEQRVDRDLHVAVGAVLEADRRREAGGQLAVHLAFGGAGADRAPGHEVADVLRRDHVEELAAGRHAGLVDAHQQIARDAQALVDAEAAVEVRVVDQALPAHRGARLLEIDAHQDLELVA